MAVTKVLVVDDFLPWHRLVRAMLAARKDLEIFAVAVDGLEAVQKAEHLQPDLILLDIGLPTLNGIEAARRIRKLSPKSKILFVSQEVSAEMVEEAFRLGASGYLLKFDAVRELLLAVDAVLRGERFVGSRLGPYSGQSRLALQKPVARRVHELASYRADSSFIDGFTRFIETALLKGNPAIVIATASHRTRILDELRARAGNLASAIQNGLYISFDVHEAISAFMMNDWPDPTRLAQWADNAIRAARPASTGPSRRVAICGECAPILLAQGKAEAAIQLERLWDIVAEVHEVDILCGYPCVPLRHTENSQIFESIRAAHSAEYSL
jgi:DNA-binding NarL/FixJ family response regulator